MEIFYIIYDCKLEIYDIFFKEVVLGLEVMLYILENN